MKDWVDPGTDLQDDPEYDFGIPPPNEQDVLEQTEMTKKLFTYMTYADDLAPKPEMNIFNTLKQSMEVLEKHCAEAFLFDPDFIKNVYAAFHFVAIKFGALTQLNDLGTREHSLIVDALRRCKNNPLKYKINSTSCGTASRVSERTVSAGEL